MKLIFFLVACLTCIIPMEMYGQSDCNAYSTALDFLYTKFNTVDINNTRKIDPQKPEASVNSLKPNYQLIPYRLYIEQDLFKVDSTWLFNSFQTVVKRGKLNANTYKKIKGIQISSCNFSPAICYSFISSDQAKLLDYKIPERCPSQKDSLLFKEKIAFSNLMLSKSGKVALVCARIMTGNGRGNESGCLIVLNCKRGKWKAVDIAFIHQ